MLVLRSGDDMILIDAGMMFPEAELLGVDIVDASTTSVICFSPQVLSATSASRRRPARAATCQCDLQRRR